MYIYIYYITIIIYVYVYIFLYIIYTYYTLLLFLSSSLNLPSSFLSPPSLPSPLSSSNPFLFLNSYLFSSSHLQSSFLSLSPNLPSFLFISSNNHSIRVGTYITLFIFNPHHLVNSMSIQIASSYSYHLFSQLSSNIHSLLLFCSPLPIPSSNLSIILYVSMVSYSYLYSFQQLVLDSDRVLLR